MERPPGATRSRGPVGQPTSGLGNRWEREDGSGTSADRRLVTAGERLRMELLAHLRDCPPGEEASVRVELIMFYGEAFDMVVAVLTAPLTPGSTAVRVLHEAICGYAAFHLWQETETTLGAPGT